MHRNVRLAAIVLAGICIEISTLSASAAPAGDACALLTQTQVSTVLGVSADAGAHEVPGFLATCTWAETGGPPIGSKNVVLSLKTTQAFDNGAKLVSGHTTPATGLGDAAYYTALGTTGQHPNLSVKKGNAAFNIAVYGDYPTDQVKAMEKTLAEQVLSQL